ncbi:uncharacterized protein LOC130900005 [Diorhabda carinulata]|uniref:uncharacterized protein LOC130900005 n=1 Tax=Diorhabda carinulata TaxID=1163345 RepID=UPI0025A19B14|nr:uncharacterized protein LOC130900005 [Diorhabda carinulata]
MTVEIVQLEQLLNAQIGEGKKIVNSKVSPLTFPGENYGSEMLKVDVSIEAEDGTHEQIHLVAKLIPRNHFAKIVFNVQVSFMLETKFYEIIIPTLQKFQSKQGYENVIDSFPKFYCARNNLRIDSNIIDDDAVLVLENLKAKGYGNVDRRVGFDLSASKLILKKLAEFHAVPIALKFVDPETFDTKIKAHMAFNYPLKPFSPLKGSMENIYALMSESENCSRLIPKMEMSVKKFSKLCDDIREPFATIGHRDLWVNNIMVKLNGEDVVDCKFVDFQMYSYDSPAADLFFFLFSSVQEKVLRNNLDELLEYYHRHFVETLKLLKCDLQFSYEKLLQEITFSTEWELAHTVFMYLFIINGGQHAMPEGADFEINLSKIQFEKHIKRRIIWMIEECERRKWLDF